MKWIRDELKESLSLQEDLRERIEGRTRIASGHIWSSINYAVA